MKIASVSEMKSLDEQAIREYGLSAEILMENAGIAAYSVIQKEVGVKDKRFVVFCGSGNNGGDGLVLSRKLASSGALVTVFLLGSPEKLSSVSKLNLDRVFKQGVEVLELKHINQIVEISLLKADAIIDAIFGIGISRPVTGLHKEIIKEINGSNKVIFSIDIPSGVNGDTGEVMGEAVKASYTITFGLPKIGLFAYPGAQYAGKLYISHISFPAKLTECDEIKTFLNIPEKIPERREDGHKGDFGKALFIAGSSSFTGAPFFSSMAFLKSGGGVSYLAAPKSIIYFASALSKEVVLLPQEETTSKSISYKNLKKLIEFSDKVDVVSIGQGLSLDDETERLFEDFVIRVQKPIIIDGDGITFVSRNKEIIMKRKFPTILTPHIAEFARLSGKPLGEISKFKFALIKDVAKELNSIIVLKGAYSLISNGEEVFINPTGNCGMATAGSGDVLDGTIAAFLAAGLPPIEAARTAVFIHGLSGDLKAKVIGRDGLTAKDILEGLPFAIKYFRDSYNDILGDSYERARAV